MSGKNPSTTAKKRMSSQDLEALLAERKQDKTDLEYLLAEREENQFPLSKPPSWSDNLVGPMSVLLSQALIMLPVA